MTKKILLLSLALSLLQVKIAQADEQLLNYTYSSEVMPKGTAQVYQWVTNRVGKEEGEYNASDYRTEFEYGLTNRLQASLYLDARSHHIKNSAPHEEDPYTGMHIADYPNLNRAIGFDGVSAAFKYNILSPFLGNGFGLALYVEPGYSTIFKISGEKMRQYSLETKLILQQNFFQDRLVTALNFSPEFEKRKFRKEGSRWQDELAFEVTAGASYLVVPNWYVGFEGRYHSEYPSAQEKGTFANLPKYDAREHYAIFFGPTIHYGTKKWWFTATWLPQIIGGMNGDGQNGRRHLMEHEKNEYRFKVAYNF